jgi:hypothetical protein
MAEGRGDFDDADIWALQGSARLLDALIKRTLANSRG